MTVGTPTQRALADTPCKIRAGDLKEPDGGLGQLDVHSSLSQHQLELTSTRCQIAKLTITLTDAPKPFPDLKTVPFGMVRARASAITTA